VKRIGGKDYQATVTRYIGRATYEDHGDTIEADELHIIDYGPKLGKTTVYVRYPPEGEDEGLYRLMATAQRILSEGFKCDEQKR
jgi:hypothetical protein